MNTPKIVDEFRAWYRDLGRWAKWAPIAVVVALLLLLAMCAPYAIEAGR